MMITLKLDPARATLIGSFMNSYLKLTAPEKVVYDREVEKIAPAEREVIMKLTNEWFDEGKVEGILEGQHILLKNILPGRFGNGADAFVDQLEQLSPAMFNALAQHLYEFKELTDVKRWLASHP